MKKQKQEQTGQVNFVWALAGGYLIYLGGKLLYSLYRDGADSTPILVVIPAAAVFIGVGKNQTSFCKNSPTKPT